MLARVDTPLKLVMADQGRTQIWLANRIGARPEQVNRWLHGLHTPAPDTQRRIAEALDRDVAELFPSVGGHSGDLATPTADPTPSVGKRAA